MPRSHEPVDPTNVEARLSRQGAVAVLAAAPVAVAVAAAAAGSAGAVSAGVAAAIIAAVHLMMGPPLSWAANKGPEALMGVALGGFALRLALYAGLLVAFRGLDWIHGTSFALAGAALLVVSLAWEMRAAVKTPGFYWVYAGRGDEKGSMQ